jgi:hypothetical protein
VNSAAKAPRGTASRRLAFLGTLTFAQLVLAWRGLGTAPLADIDSVCHVAYVDYFVKVFWPETHALVGYTPDFNLGAPFLLFNVPPGVTWAGAALVALGLSAATAIKALLYAGWLAVPVLAFFLADALAALRPIEDRGGSLHPLLPYAAATLFSLFSSDLFGLEFFLHSGMVNACLGLPLILAGLLGFVRALGSPGRVRVVAHVLAGGVAAATILTHVLSAYFLALAIGCVVFAGSWRHLGTRAVAAGVVVVVGALLTAWWVLPSSLFAPGQKSSYNWIRGSKDTLFAFFDGSALSSVFDAFAPRYRRLSNAGLVAVVPGIVGVFASFGSREAGFRAMSVFWAVCLAVAMGPHPSFGVGWLPGYERLLWYRFMTPAIAAWLFVAAYGVERLFTLAHRFGHRGVTAAKAVAAVAVALPVGTLTEAAAKLETTDRYPEFLDDYARVVAWLRANGDRRARVFSEFLAFPESPVPSVNYVRQRLPVDSGIPEVGGWVYENSLASARLVDRGLLWWGAGLYTDESEHLDLGYVVANTPATIRAFEHDARWAAVVRRPNLVLFARKGFEPGLFTAGARGVAMLREERAPLGGYRYGLRVGAGEGSIVARISASPAWHARVNGNATPLTVRPDGFFEVPLPPEAAEVELVWSIEAPMRRGFFVTDAALLAFAVAGVVVARTKRGHTSAIVLPTALENAARVAAIGVTAAIVGVGQRHRVEGVHFGPANGVAAPDRSRHLALGTAQELEDGALVSPDLGAFGPADLVAGTPVRSPLPGARAHVHVRVAPGGHVRLTTEPPSRFVVEAVDSLDRSAPCAFAVTSGEPFTLPRACATADRDPSPGEAFALRLVGSPALARVDVDDDVRVVQAESFWNLHDDGPHDALPWPGLRGDPMNGMLQVASASPGERIATAWRSTLPAGRYRAWILANRVPPRFAPFRADFALTVDGARVGAVEVVDERLPDAESEWNVHPGWLRVGEADLTTGALVSFAWERRPGSLGGFGAWDAIAFEPVTE